MSNWTHVAAIVRIDSFRTINEHVLDFTKIFGKTVEFHSSETVWNDAYEHPENYLPMGSEGSLEMSVYINPDVSELAAYTVSIFGDLRDHDDPDQIIDWFKNKLKDKFVRQAVITVENEWNGTRSWTWTDQENNNSEQ